MENPYVGPKPFDAKDERYFYGREVEVVELTSLVQAHQAVLLYSMSGAGKTSLLKAKVVTELTRAGEVVLGSADGVDPLVRTSGPQPAGPDMFVKNILSCIGKEALGHGSLTEFVQHLPDSKTPSGLPSLQVMILDQLEEIFTLSPDRWNARRRLFEDIAAALDANPRFRILLAMREEFVAGMEPYAESFPESLKTRYRLERLDVEAASDAIRLPVENNELGKYANDAVTHIVTELRKRSEASTGDPDVDHDEFVEPIFLQLGLATMWPSVAHREEIDLSAVLKNFNLEGALEGHFSGAIKEIVDDKSPLKPVLTRHNINEAKLRLWFENELLTGSRRELVERGGSESAGMPNEIVDFLSKRYVLRSEPRIGKTFVELTHDRFVRAVLDSNAAWRRDQRWDVDLVALERRARAYAGNRTTPLMTDDEIDELTQLLAAKSDVSAGVSDALMEYLGVSQQAAKDRRLRIFRRGVVVLGFLLVAAIALGSAAALKWSESITANKDLQTSQATLAKKDQALQSDRNRLEAAKTKADKQNEKLFIQTQDLRQKSKLLQSALTTALSASLQAQNEKARAEVSAEKARQSEQRAAATLSQLVATHRRVLQASVKSRNFLLGLNEILSSDGSLAFRLPSFERADSAWLANVIGLAGAATYFAGTPDNSSYWPQYCYSSRAKTLGLSVDSVCRLYPLDGGDRPFAISADSRAFRLDLTGRLFFVYKKVGIEVYDSETGEQLKWPGDPLHAALGAHVSADSSYVLSDDSLEAKGFRLTRLPSGISAVIPMPPGGFQMVMPGAFAISDPAGLSIRSSADGHEIGRAKENASVDTAEALSPSGQRYAWVKDGVLHADLTKGSSPWEQKVGEDMSQVWWQSDRVIRCCSPRGQIVAWDVVSQRQVQSTEPLVPKGASPELLRDAWGPMVYMSWVKDSVLHCANVDLQSGNRNGPVRCPFPTVSAELSSDGKYLFFRLEHSDGVLVVNVADQRTLAARASKLGSQDLLRRASRLRDQLTLATR